MFDCCTSQYETHVLARLDGMRTNKEDEDEEEQKNCDSDYKLSNKSENEKENRILTKFAGLYLYARFHSYYECESGRHQGDRSSELMLSVQGQLGSDRYVQIRPLTCYSRCVERSSDLEAAHTAILEDLASFVHTFFAAMF